MGRDVSFDVFLSYARSDGAAAAELNGWLRAQGFHTFFDRSELSPGLRWIPALEDAIGHSDAVVILVGRHGFGNTQQYERELALVRQTRDEGFPVIPVLMPGCDNPPTGFLQLLTWIDLSRGDNILQQTDSLEALLKAIHRQSLPLSSIRTEICPYRGLESFREEDAAFFCGRDDAIHDLVARVQAHAFVAVVGPSGSGKSSLVFAGLLPALRQQRQTMMWDVVSFRPGASPLRALAAAFGTIPENAGPAAIDTYLQSEAAAYRTGGAGTLANIVNDRLDAAPEKPDRLLIYVDQWEELYSMAPAAEDAERRQQHSDDAETFITLLVAAASDSRSRATVVLTVRADFYNPLIRHTLLSTLLPRQQVNIPPMGSSDLRSAIETPAKKVGLSFAPPALVNQILNDVGMDEGRLPLLQFALKEIWEGRQGDRLTAEAYTEAGGVQGAIQKTAERAYATLTPTQQEAARRLFLRLVTPGEGQEDTRVRSAIPDDPDQRKIVNLFSNSRTRLLVTGYDALQGPATQAGSDVRETVEVAHEALIRRWPTLRAWVDGNREKLRARAVILRARAEWEEAGKDDKFLLPSGIQLERGRTLLDSPGDVAVDDIRNYVHLSIEKEKRRLEAEREAALADQRRIADAERQAKQTAEEAARQSDVAREASEVARRKLRNRLIQTAAVGAIALLALAASLVERSIASKNESKAVKQAEETQHQLARATIALAEGRLNDLDLTPDRSFTARQRNALWKLAMADEAVQLRFISALSTSPEDMGRVAAGFRVVSRSLGFQRPTPAEAEKFFFAALAALEWPAREPKTARAVVIAFQALAGKLTDAQAQQALAQVLKQFDRTTDPDVLRALAQAIEALPTMLTEGQAQRALAPVLHQIGQSTDSDALQVLGQAFQALAGKLSEEQAQEALDLEMKQFGQTTNSGVLKALAQAIPALSVKLTEAQAQQALAAVMEQIDQTTDPDLLQALARAIRPLAAKLTDTQAQQALPAVLKQFDRTTDLEALKALAQVIEKLPTKPTEAQVKQALAAIQKPIAQTTDAQQMLLMMMMAIQQLSRAQRETTRESTVLPAWAWTIQALAPKLSEAQTQEVLAELLKQFDRTTDPSELRALVYSIQALQAKLTESQAQQALVPVLRQVDKADSNALPVLAQVVQALAGRLNEVQAQQALVPVLRQFNQSANADVLKALAQAISALAFKLTEAPAEQALAAVMKQIDQTTDPYEVRALAQAIQALAGTLTEAQAGQTLVPLLRQFDRTTDPDVLRALAQAIQALPAKLTDAQAQQALAQVLQMISQTTRSDTLQILAGAFQALAEKLTGGQAQQTLAPILQQISQTTRSDALQVMAQVSQSLAGRLTEAQAQQATLVATSSLAWAATEDEAADWARALVGLLPRAKVQNETRELILAIVYPTAAGSASDVLLEGIRARHSNAPAKEAGTAAGLAWIAETYPDLVRRPICPPPPQPTSLSALKCPVAETEESTTR